MTRIFTIVMHSLNNVQTDLDMPITETNTKVTTTTKVFTIRSRKNITIMSTTHKTKINIQALSNSSTNITRKDRNGNRPKIQLLLKISCPLRRTPRQQTIKKLTFKRQHRINYQLHLKVCINLFSNLFINLREQKSRNLHLILLIRIDQHSLKRISQLLKNK